MGKNKRRNLSSRPGKSTPHKLTLPSSIGKFHPKPNNSKPTTTTKKQPSTQHTHPTIPFSPLDRILLIGEGDLSFALSLIKFHCCKNIIATVYENQTELVEKYPYVLENVRAIEEGGGRVRLGVDASKVRGKGWKDLDGGVDRVVFNFPHVGGKSRDVNRQVRFNQELLVSFFKTALPSLSPKPGSSIIVTLFEGEPYTLWNIRDLGRHAGLEVKESFKFQAGAYPGYRHARTIGVIRGKERKGGKFVDGKGDGEVDEERHGWRGEERKARSYVFVRKGEGQVQGPGKGKGDSSDDESESDDGIVEEIEEIDEDKDDDEELEGEEEEVDVIEGGEIEDGALEDHGMSECETDDDDPYPYEDEDED